MISVSGFTLKILNIFIFDFGNGYLNYFSKSYPVWLDFNWLVVEENLARVCVSGIVHAEIDLILGMYPLGYLRVL